MKSTFAYFVLAAVLRAGFGHHIPVADDDLRGAGVADSGGAAGVGSATAFHCLNVSGVTTSVRFVVLNGSGTAVASFTRAIAHGATATASTHTTSAYTASDLATGFVSQGGINIESLQSGVFCNAKTIDAAAGTPIGVTLPLVRVNPHPGTVE